MCLIAGISLRLLVKLFFNVYPIDHGVVHRIVCTFTFLKVEELDDLLIIDSTHHAPAVEKKLLAAAASSKRGV